MSDLTKSPERKKASFNCEQRDETAFIKSAKQLIEEYERKSRRLRVVVSQFEMEMELRLQMELPL